MRLSQLSYARGLLEYGTRKSTEPEHNLARYLEEGRASLEAALSTAHQGIVETGEALPSDFEALRWFPLPSERSQDMPTESLPNAA